MRRARSRIIGTGNVPRLAVFRSNRFLYVQLIDDEHAKTLVHASSKEIETKGKKETKTKAAASVGILLSERAKAKGIERAVFDRRQYRYHGRVQALAEGARKGGLKI